MESKISNITEESLRTEFPTISRFFDSGNPNEMEFSLFIEEPELTSFIMRIPKGMVYPIHDHRDFSLISKILKGKLEIETFDIVHVHQYYADLLKQSFLEESSAERLKEIESERMRATGQGLEKFDDQNIYVSVVEAEWIIWLLG